MPKMNWLASFALCRLQFSTHLLGHRQQAYLSRQTSLIQSSHTPAGILLRIGCHMLWCICIVPLQQQQYVRHLSPSEHGFFSPFWPNEKHQWSHSWFGFPTGCRNHMDVAVFSKNRKANICLKWLIHLYRLDRVDPSKFISTHIFPLIRLTGHNTYKQ